MTLSGMTHMSGSKETVAFGNGLHGWCFNVEVTSAPCRRVLKAVVAIETAVSEIDLFIFLKSISPSCRMSKFGSMDQFSWLKDYGILCMLVCLVSSVTVLD